MITGVRQEPTWVFTCPVESCHLYEAGFSDQHDADNALYEHMGERHDLFWTSKREKLRDEEAHRLKIAHAEQWDRANQAEQILEYVLMIRTYGEAGSGETWDTADKLVEGFLRRSEPESPLHSQTVGEYLSAKEKP